MTGLGRRRSIEETVKHTMCADRCIRLTQMPAVLYNPCDSLLIKGGKMSRSGINLFPSVIILCVTLAIWSLDANAQSFLPVGPQTDVPVDTVTGGGWIECYRDLYINELDADTVLRICPGERLMLSCSPTGSSTLALLAQGDRSDVIFDTGNSASSLHVANGVGWYFNDTDVFSWGFVREGDNVQKENCDTDTSGANDERLCWHLSDDGGYRCGAITGLNESDSFERIVYTSAPPPIPTLSQWGVIAMAGILGIAGYIVMRRRKVTA